MILMDVNVLVYAHREDVKDHLLYHEWLESIVNSESAFGYLEVVLSAFLRVVTHCKVFEQPSSLAIAIAFVEQIRTAPQAVCVAPGKNHWKLFVQCVEEISAQGNDVPDPYLAALALEWDCDWVTTDKGFRRFNGLRVRHPLK